MANVRQMKNFSFRAEMAGKPSEDSFAARVSEMVSTQIEGHRVSESITVTWAWLSVGRVTLVGGKLGFPRMPNTAGVYRITFVDAVGMRTGVYAGEADLLPRRFQHYRTPGLRQHTNLCMNPIMTTTLSQGGHVSVEIATEAQIASRNDEPMLLDLSQKAARVLVERTAEVIERQGIRWCSTGDYKRHGAIRAPANPGRSDRWQQFREW